MQTSSYIALAAALVATAAQSGALLTVTRAPQVGPSAVESSLQTELPNFAALPRLASVEVVAYPSQPGAQLPRLAAVEVVANRDKS